MNSLILYTTEEGRSHLQLRADEQTVWLTQLEMADLFDATKQNISLHLKNLFEDGELDPAATVKESLTVQTEGGREARRRTSRQFGKCKCPECPSCGFVPFATPSSAAGRLREFTAPGG